MEDLGVKGISTICVKRIEKKSDVRQMYLSNVPEFFRILEMFSERKWVHG